MRHLSFIYYFYVELYYSSYIKTERRFTMCYQVNGNLELVVGKSDASHLQRGNIFFVDDTCVTANNGRYAKNEIRHPYIIMSKFWSADRPLVTCFSINSHPYRANMVPLLNNRNQIVYVDPFTVYHVPADRITTASFKGTIGNMRLMNLISDLYGLTLGMNLVRSTDEILDDYTNYIDEFRERSKGFSEVDHFKDMSKIPFMTNILTGHYGEDIFIKFGEDNEDHDETTDIITDDHHINSTSSEPEVVVDPHELCTCESVNKKTRKPRVYITDDDWSTAMKMFGRYEVTRGEVCEMLDISMTSFCRRHKKYPESLYLSNDDIIVARKNYAKIKKLPPIDQKRYAKKSSKKVSKISQNTTT